jgi:hypothetical protein
VQQVVLRHFAATGTAPQTLELDPAAATAGRTAGEVLGGAGPRGLPDPRRCRADQGCLPLLGRAQQNPEVTGKTVERSRAEQIAQQTFAPLVST